MTQINAPPKNLGFSSSAGYPGLQLKRMTTSQRDALGSTVLGSAIYNTTADRAEVYTGGTEVRVDLDLLDIT